MANLANFNDCDSLKSEDASRLHESDQHSITLTHNTKFFLKA